MTSQDQTSDPADAGDLIEEDVAGVQGGEGEEEPDRTGQIAPPGQTPDQPAPDGAEIEWAGGVVKKPPAPEGRGG